MDVVAYNQAAWDRNVQRGNRWTLPVSPEVIAAARRGDWHIILTPTKPVPRDWFPALAGARLLCLAGGGGQQGPILAAAGAHVTVFDNSTAQLGQDAHVAAHDGLPLTTVHGDMTQPLPFTTGEFDLIVHPCSNCFIPDVRPLWREASRVLRPGGTLLAGFCNPVAFLFDEELKNQGTLQMCFSAPYSDLTSLSEAQRRRYIDEGLPLVFGHTLQDQIGGQLDAGLQMLGFYEDYHDPKEDLLARYLPTFAATRCVKPANP